MRYRYPGIQSFSQEDEALFFGRAQDAEKLYRLLRLEQMVVLYGKSGYGKSSLLQAAVLPRLKRETAFTAIPVRFYAYNPNDEAALLPLQRTIAAIRSAMPEAGRGNYLDKLIPHENSLWYSLKQVQSAGPAPQSKFVLVFDQFEEIFTYPEKAILQFRAQLAGMLYVQIPQNFRSKFNRDRGALSPEETALFFTDLEVRALFSIRSDYMHLMNRLKDYLPQILRNCYELDALTREQAREAIEEPARQERAGYSPTFAYAPDSLDLLLNYLSNDGKEKIESFQLQLICQHIEREWVVGRNDRRIEAADFGATPEERRAQLRDINRNYYNTCIAKLPENQQSVARLIVENELVTAEDKRRITVDGGMLVSRYRSAGATEALLEALKNTYLLRAETTPRGTAYELSHDALIEPILKARGEREAQEARQRQLAAQKAAERKTRRLIALGVLALAVAAGAVVFAFWAWRQKLEADTQRKAADTQRQLAYSKALEAQRNLEGFYKAKAAEVQVKVDQLEQRGDELIATGNPEPALFLYEQADSLARDSLVRNSMQNTRKRIQQKIRQHQPEQR
jgi:hypothetical protein